MGMPKEAVIRGKTKTDQRKHAETVNIIEVLNRASAAINQGLAWISGCSLLLIVFLVVLNGVSRVVYVPFSGATEITGWLGAMSTSFALGYTQLNKGHVDIDILTQKFPPSWRHSIKTLVLLVSTVFFGLVAWKIVIFALNVAGEGNVSETLGLPFYPLIILMALGFSGLALALLADLLNHIFGGAEQ